MITWFLILCTPVEKGAVCLNAVRLPSEATCKAMIEEYRASAGPVGGWAVNGRCFKVEAPAQGTE